MLQSFTLHVVNMSFVIVWNMKHEFSGQPWDQGVASLGLKNRTIVLSYCKTTKLNSYSLNSPETLNKAVVDNSN